MIMPVCGKDKSGSRWRQVDHDDHQDLLDDLMAQVAPCSARRETRLTCKDMVHGLLSELEDRNCWTLAEAAGHACPYRMQHLLSRARCDEQRMLDTAAGWAAGRLCAGQDGADAVLIVDETAGEKSSDSCAGASRQYSGTVGGTAMCQVAVTLTWAALAPVTGVFPAGDFLPLLETGIQAIQLSPYHADLPGAPPRTPPGANAVLTTVVSCLVNVAANRK